MRHLRHSQRGIVLKGLLFAVPVISAVMAATWPGSLHPPRMCVSASAEQAVFMLRRETPTAADRRAVELVAAVQQDLDRLTSLELDQLPVPDASAARDLANVRLVDAHNQIRRIRDGYAWIATSPALTRALLVLADANQQRAEMLHQIRIGSAGAAESTCANQDVGLLWRTILDWADDVHPRGAARDEPTIAPPHA